MGTVPQDQAARKRVWFMSYGAGLAKVNTVQAPVFSMNNYLRFQAYDSRSEIAFASAAEKILLTKRPDRGALPYPPTRVWFNGQSYPASITGELTVSWSHRNRLETWSYADSRKTATAESGTEYDALVYGELGTLVHTESGLTGTSWTSGPLPGLTSGPLHNHLRRVLQFVVNSMNDLQAVVCLGNEAIKLVSFCPTGSAAAGLGIGESVECELFS